MCWSYQIRKEGGETQGRREGRQTGRKGESEREREGGREGGIKDYIVATKLAEEKLAVYTATFIFEMESSS